MIRVLVTAGGGMAINSTPPQNLLGKLTFRKIYFSRKVEWRLSVVVNKVSIKKAGDKDGK